MDVNQTSKKQMFPKRSKIVTGDNHERIFDNIAQRLIAKWKQNGANSKTLESNWLPGQSLQSIAFLWWKLFISWFIYFCSLPQVLMEVMQLDQLARVDKSNKWMSECSHVIFLMLSFSCYLSHVIIFKKLFAVFWWQTLGYNIQQGGLSLHLPSVWKMENGKGLIFLASSHHQKMGFVGEMDFATVVLEGEGNFITDAHHAASPTNISSSSSSFPWDWHGIPSLNPTIFYCV